MTGTDRIDHAEPETTAPRDAISDDLEMARIVCAGGRWSEPYWKYRDEVLLPYGRAVIIGWSHQGRLRSEVFAKQRRHLPLQLDTWERDDVAGEIAHALQANVDRFLLTYVLRGGYDPTQGKRLPALFVDCSVHRVADALWTYAKAAGKEELLLVDDPVAAAGAMRYLVQTKQHNPEDEATDNALVEQLLTLMTRTEQKIFVMYAYCFSYEEIGTQLGMSAEAVRKQKERFVERYRSNIGARGPDEKELFIDRRNGRRRR